MRPVQVLVVADQLLRDLLVARWSREPWLAVVSGRTDEGWEDLAARRADVVVLDLALRPPRWEHGVAALREACPGLRVVVLAQPGEESAHGAARAGASGWLAYGSSVDELTETVRLVHEGHGVYPSRVLAAVLDGLRADIAEARRPTGRLSALTEREVEVLRALVDGLSARDVADHLDVAVNTVRTHTHRIFRKLGVHGRLEAVRIARAEGLAPLAEAVPASPTASPTAPSSRPVRLVRERDDEDPDAW
ncbi:response regulator transcription factor [Actinomycetospora lutea]|uniref:response regulator transcription factor n=1 Tax=Actinomycetospora lutea TaxID=663604 RepID=UPI002365B5FF|nr:response regulator transcription factor [Actinomycetospora lutea]MDD7940862.1 response regulator transcription factor [Actinomycetospora lutea]